MWGQRGVQHHLPITVINHFFFTCSLFQNIMESKKGAWSKITKQANIFRYSQSMIANPSVIKMKPHDAMESQFFYFYKGPFLPVLQCSTVAWSRFLLDGASGPRFLLLPPCCFGVNSPLSWPNKPGSLAVKRRVISRVTNSFNGQSSNMTCMLGKFIQLIQQLLSMLFCINSQLHLTCL